MPLRRLTFLLLSILSVLGCTAFGPPVLADGDNPSHPLAPHEIHVPLERPVPQITAQSAILVNHTTGRILYALNEHERRAPASLVKLVTAMVALERGRQDQLMYVKGEDLSAWSSVHLQPNEELSMRQLLFMLLISSDNVAALTIAKTLGKDFTTFVGWMNDMVAQWGLQDTHFRNPHGLDHKHAYSSAWDMAIISRQAMANPVIADIVRRATAIAAYRELVNTNELLNTYPGTIGIKTGTEESAGECLACMVDREQGVMLSVVMGSSDRYYDTRMLMDYAYANYAELHLALDDSVQNRYLDEGGSWHDIELRDPQVLLLTPWERRTISFYRRIDNAGASPDLNQPIGALEVRMAGEYLTEVPLYARQ